VWEQYDQSVGADTVQRPGGDAAVVRVHGTRKALAITTDCTPRYCYASPYEGGKQAVAEAYRNLCAVGAKPLAITNCLNFGNPQRPEIMAQFVEALRGMGDACRALDFPIVSGNVSLYNESKATGGGSAILPTPAIGGVGLLDDWEKSATIGFKAEGEAIILIGGERAGTKEGSPLTAHLGQSLYSKAVLGEEAGDPPPINLTAERRAGKLVRSLIQDGLVSAVHDCSDGGIAVSLAEMALAGDIGMKNKWISAVSNPAPVLFGEGQGRYLVTTSERELVEARVAEKMLLSFRFGFTGGNALTFEWGQGRSSTIPLADLRAAHEGFFPKLMGADAALA
jgi:phosphoribosylformylglycinamidine synthase